MRFTDAASTNFSSQSTLNVNDGRHHQRRATHPFRKTGRSKPRRWPLVLRFIKGAIHGAILVHVISHALFTTLVVCLDKYVYDELGLPPTIIPSLSIVVGLILVFRNQTSYNRFWDGRTAFSALHSANRNLIRSILVQSRYTDRPLTTAEKNDIERVMRVLIAFPYTVKNYLRAEWYIAPPPGSVLSDSTEAIEGGGSSDQEYTSLLPSGFQVQEDEGLGIPLQLTFFVEDFIQRGIARGWYDPPGASNMGNQVNALIDAYGKMETIKLTPIPVAHLIHQRQVLALFGCVLPFAMVDDMGWWAVPIVSVVIFTLYGIEGIGSQLEDPFGYDRNDIKMDAIVDDEKVEIQAILNEWRRVIAAAEQPSTNSSTTAVNGGASSAPQTPDVNGVRQRKEMFIR